MGRRVLRRVLRRGSKKALSRRKIEGRNTPFREYDPVGVRPSLGQVLSGHWSEWIHSVSCVWMCEAFARDCQVCQWTYQGPLNGGGSNGGGASRSGLVLPCLLFLVFFFFGFPCFCRSKDFLAFLPVLPFFPKDFRGSATIENPCFFGGFPCRSPKKARKRRSGFLSFFVFFGTFPILPGFSRFARGWSGDLPDSSLVSFSAY